MYMNLPLYNYIKLSVTPILAFPYLNGQLFGHSRIRFETYGVFDMHFFLSVGFYVSLFFVFCILISVF